MCSRSLLRESSASRLPVVAWSRLMDCMWSNGWCVCPCNWRRALHFISFSHNLTNRPYSMFQPCLSFSYSKILHLDAQVHSAEVSTAKGRSHVPLASHPLFRNRPRPCRDLCSRASDTGCGQIAHDKEVVGSKGRLSGVVSIDTDLGSKQGFAVDWSARQLFTAMNLPPVMGEQRACGVMRMFLRLAQLQRSKESKCMKKDTRTQPLCLHKRIWWFLAKFLASAMVLFHTTTGKAIKTFGLFIQLCHSPNAAWRNDAAWSSRNPRRFDATYTHPCTAPLLDDMGRIPKCSLRNLTKPDCKLACDEHVGALAARTAVPASKNHERDDGPDTCSTLQTTPQAQKRQMPMHI